MRSKIYKYFLICFISFLHTIPSVHAQCEWLYENRPEGSYVIENDKIILFYCENLMDVIYAPDEYIDVYWEYTTETGQQCQDWDWSEDDFFFSVNYNDPCIEELGNNTITVTFTGVIDETLPPETCTFDILFNDPGDPTIQIGEGGGFYDTNQQITICENNNIILTASSLGSNADYSSFQWYLNGELIENENSIELIINNTNYDINSANTFYFSVTNYCSSLEGNSIDSEWLTVGIYEGYDQCEPCNWDLPDYDSGEFYGFCIDCEGDGYFPEKPNNEENRSFENTLRIPTCEATTYRLTIYNRLGRELFQSEHDNHPWDGKLKNGRKCKEGTYYYKLEYVLNPSLDEDQQNETKISTGTVYLDWGN